MQDKSKSLFLSKDVNGPKFKGPFRPTLVHLGLFRSIYVNARLIQ